MNPRSRIALIALVVAVLLAVSACDNSSDTTSTNATDTTIGDPTAPTTTTRPPLEAIPGSDIPGDHSPSISDDIDMAMRDEIGGLMIEAEVSRSLPWLAVPTVTILDATEFTSRVQTDVAAELDPVEIAVDESFLQLMGMLDESTDLNALLVSLYAEQVLGFYDPEAKELVVPAAPDGFTPLQRMTVVHELVHALTDQHFDFGDTTEEVAETGTSDTYSSLLAVIEGDATYQQLLYLESMDPSDAVQVALEALETDTSALDDAPAWIALDLAFPYERGLTFIGEIIADNGLKGVDEVYQDPPTTTEQILEPRKYLRRETPDPIDPVAVTLSGWEVYEDDTWGEWGVRLLLNDTVTPGMVTQASSGWDNDTYRVLINDSDVATAWHYRAESEQDAEDLVNALITHARTRMGASSSQESAGGLLMEGSGKTVFIDRIEDEFYFIASTDSDAVSNIRSQLGI